MMIDIDINSFSINILKVQKMLHQPRSRAERLIYQRRTQDEKRQNLQTKLKQEFNQKQFAKWENKGQDLEIANKVKIQLQKLRKESQANLNSRREKLYNLLSSETNKYQDQILKSQETPQQIRQRMFQRVKFLKQEKQQRRKEDANAKLEKRFEQGADELRKVDQELKELKVAYERDIQMVEKQNKLQDNYQEQMIFAELNRRDQKQKQQLQKIKLLEQKQKIEERNAILAIQTQLKNKKKNQEKQLSEMEKQMLKQQWQRQSQMQKIKQKDNIEKNKNLITSLYQQNERQKKIKDQQILLERQRDKEIIERIVEKERKLAQYQKLMKLNEREEAKRILKGVKNKNMEIAAYQKELDRLIQIERLKKEKKEEEEWQKRQKARVNLLYDVYQDRQRKVKDHQVQREKERKAIEEDRAEVQRRVIQHQKQQQLKRKEEYIRNKKQQENLLEEIAAKEERRRLILMQLQKEQQQIEERKKQYDRKISQRKERGRQQLETFKKTNRLY